MADQQYTFEQARIRLEEIAIEVRKKDTSLERSLDLLEEGVRLANICTELVDHADFDARPNEATSGQDASLAEPTALIDGAPDGLADAAAADEADSQVLESVLRDGSDGSEEAEDDLAEPSECVDD